MALFSEVLAAGVTIRESANDGSDFSNPTADYRRLFLGEDGLLHVKDSSGTVTSPYSSSSGTSLNPGTSFPGGPSDNDLCFRTDRDKLYTYVSGSTHWRTVNEYSQGLSVLDNNLPHTATDSKLYGAVDLGDNGIWVTRMVCVTLGIGIDGSNYWTYQLNKRDLDSAETAVGGSFSTNADTTSKWIRHNVTIGSAVTTGLTWALKATKVSSPTSTYEAAVVYYQQIGYMPTFVGLAPTAEPPDVPDEPDPPDRPTVTDEFGGTTLAQLQTFVDGADDGAVIGLVNAAVITGGASDGLDLTDRHDLTFVGRNATLRRTSRGTDQIVQMNGQTSGIDWYDVTIEGQNPGEWDVTYEHEHAFALRSATDILFDNVSVLNVGGDGLYVSGVVGSIWSANVAYQNGSMDGIGRNAVSITDGGEDVNILYNAITNVYYYTLDLEANGVSVDGRAAGALRILFDHNAIGTHPYGNVGEGGPVGHFFAITGSSGGGPADLITVSNNTLSDGTMVTGVYNNGGARTNIVFSGNVAVDTFTPDGDWTHTVNYSGVVGGSIINNTQPCSSPSVFSSVSGGSGVSVSGNTT